MIALKQGPLLYVLLCIGSGCAGVDGIEDVQEAPSESCAPSDTGALGPLIPMHKDAVHSGFFWDPLGRLKMLLWMRPSEYKGTDLADPTRGPIGELKESFREVVYGGFRFSDTLERSILSRIKDDIARENTLVFDTTHPDAFANRGKYDVRELDETDFAMNADAFYDRGSSAGLNYNLFCAGNTTLTDGRWLVVGGHDKSGNQGTRKLNIFDPLTETWVFRTVPPVKAAYDVDPAIRFPGLHPDALDERNTDPPARSDMRYQRWYPTAVTLPDGKVLILSGSDQDSSVGPDEAPATKVRQVVPEIYDPATDTTVALENAKKLLPMYPRSFVVQTGRHRDDWKVAVVAEVEPPLPTGDDLRDYDPFRYNGNTYLLDVRAALADRRRDRPGARHWRFVDTADFAHESGASVALLELDDDGQPLSQRIALFGGDAGNGDDVAAVEMIDFSERRPRWRRKDDLIRPATQNNAVALPDGKVLIVGGRGGPEGEERVNTLEYQLFDPDSGDIQTVARTTVPRHDHSTLQLAPDGSVYSMGGNRVDLVPEDDTLGVPVLQVYKPAYMFMGSRPVIDRAPDEISYRRSFEVQVDAPCRSAHSVAILRTDPVTHNWSWGNRYVKLSFDRIGRCKLKVHAPATGAAAPGGNYLLFVLDDRGVPSEAKRVRVGE
ncbi:galactose oxidase-like domain-containing protein [Sorangium sp. So ce1078]|uniref:galactose oxidase-like domain-containing protein n=1 Tax=Sorangium sp. So ce1078 TaxID=3133329 RepID=UPI003F6490F7